MTTIAFRDRVLAADTGLSRSGNIFGGAVVKIVQRPDGRLAGAVGSAGYAGRFLEWAKAGGDLAIAPPAKEDQQTYDTGFIVEMDGSLTIFEPSGSFRCSPPFYAFGSGKEIAMGAMAMGADAQRAVAIACTIDAGSREPITILRLGAALAQVA